MTPKFSPSVTQACAALACVNNVYDGMASNRCVAKPMAVTLKQPQALVSQSTEKQRNAKGNVGQIGFLRRATRGRCQTLGIGDVASDANFGAAGDVASDANFCAAGDVARGANF